MTPAVPEEKSWRGQFVISSQMPARDGWTAEYRVGKQRVFTYEGIRAVPVLDTADQLVGVFLGTIIDIEAERVVDEPLAIALEIGSPDIDQYIEDFAYRFGGSWILVIQVFDATRVYLDCDGSMSLVYAPDAGIAAATVGLMLDDDAYRQRFRSDLYATLGVEGEGWFPSGLTAHRGVDRLLCNHYLDLVTWSAVRHWPRDDFAWSSEPTEAALRIAEITRKTNAALLSRGPVVRALTGGNESRFLLAADREHCADYDYVTVSSPATERDVVLATRLAEVAGLSHRLLPMVEATPEAQAAWLYQSSHGVTGPNMVSHPSIAPLSDYSSFVGGLGGEIGRAFFWRPTDTETTPLTGDKVARRFGMPPCEDVTAATAAWLSGLPQMNSLSILDLAYLELRMSAWAFANAYAAPTVPHFHPMVCRESYELMLQLPPKAKRENQLIVKGVAALWPAIAEIPINRYGDYRDALHAVRRMTKPHLVMKKLRKLIG